MQIQDSILGKILVALVTLTDEVLGTLVDLCEKLTSNTGGHWWNEIKKFLRKEPCWQPHIIDLSADACVPWKNCVVTRHRKGNKYFEWDPKKVRLWISINQYDNRRMGGNELCADMDYAYNANLLDYLLTHPFLIPEDWKMDVDKRPIRVFFWGTLYDSLPHEQQSDNLVVRYIEWDRDHWQSDFAWVSATLFKRTDVAAIEG